MDLPTTDYTDQYIEFCQKAGLPINEVPEDGKMPLAYEIAMKETAPHLYQNLTRPKVKNLKADVRARYQKGIMWTSDAEEYEAKGFCGVASNIRAEMAAAREMLIEKEIEEMKARNAEVAARHANKPSGFTPAKNISFNDPSAVKARRDWGLSDDIGLGA